MKLNKTENRYHPLIQTGLIILTLTLVLTLSGPVHRALATQNTTIRVGIFDNKPMCYFDDNNKPAGIFVAVLEDISRNEDWPLVYIHDTFPALRQQLKQGDIDILLSTAVSKERLLLYAYNKIDVFNNWAEIYVAPENASNSLLDFKNKRIATLDQGIYSTGQEGIVRLNEKFDLQCTFIFVKDYKSGLEAVAAGRADGAVVNRLAGAVYAQEFNLKQSGIVFAPVALRFAFNKENPKTPDLISAVDHHLGDLIQERDSVYHQTINQALGSPPISIKEVIPTTIWVSTITGITVTLSLLIVTLLLRLKIRRAEATINKNEHKFKNLLESTNTVPWELDLRSEKFTYMGKQIEDVLGYPVESWTDLTTWTERIHPEDRDNALLFCTIQTTKGHEHDFMYRALHQNGSVRWIRDIVAVTTGEKGPEKLVGFMHDITDQKNLALEKENLESRLIQAQKMEAIGTLAGGIAHDFNNILAAIIGYTEMARDDSEEGSTIAKDLDKVLHASNRAKELVKQILAFSRQADTERVPLQPAPIVQEALKMLRPSLPTTIEIIQYISPNVGLIQADPTQIHQILINLCTNAFHAMEETGGTLSISLQETELRDDDLRHEPTVEPGRFMQLSISDSGTGIAPELQGKIFDPYFTTKETGKGTGMGLSIIHGIIKSYGGFIALESERGKGSVFHVFLPILEQENILYNETEKESPRGKEKILFVDDEALLAEMGKDMLERLGYQVTVRNSSLDALETFQNEPAQFDLIVTDQTMPGMTGMDLARRMLQIRPDIPIILCTGYSSIISEDKAKALGIREFALKPITRKTMATLIRRALEPK